MPRIADTIYAFRFLRLLTMPWTETEAYKRGIIDDQGKTIKKGLTLQDDKAAYTLFHRLVFNLRRMIQRIGGGNRIANYASALFLIKEHANLSEKEIQEVLDKANIVLDNTNLTESWMINGETLGPGKYTLVNDIMSPVTGEVVALKGTAVSVQEDTNPSDTIFNAHIYEVKHVMTRQKIFVTAGDIKR